jgi:hypothetical protein
VAAALMEGRYRLLAPGLWFWAVLSLGIVLFVLVTGQRFRGAVYGAGFITPTEGLKLTWCCSPPPSSTGHAKALAKWRGRSRFRAWSPCGSSASSRRCCSGC